MLKQNYCKSANSPKKKLDISTSKKGNKSKWGHEIELQYQYYIATLRADRDLSFLVQEHDEMYKNLIESERKNVELRKGIRLLELELMTMYQRNAHDSNVVDCLHEVAHMVSETNFQASQVLHQVSLKERESETQRNIIHTHKDQIILLRKKTDEDLLVLDNLKPAEKRLKELLDAEKLTNHQLAMGFELELRHFSLAFKGKYQDLDESRESRAEIISWLCDRFCTKEMAQLEHSQPKEDTDSAGNNSTGTEKFEIETPDVLPILPKMSEDLKGEHSCSIATLEILERENSMTTKLIHNYMSRLQEAMENLVQNKIGVYNLCLDLKLIKEYESRLHMVRKKQEHKLKEDFPVELLKQMEAIYNALLGEEEFLKEFLNHISLSMKEGLELQTLFISDLKELFVADK